ncbi:MAG: PAS domain S-box protein [Anaerolineales bacterium]|nr:PAS domain S-box protein [Anaerolineales bacterium]
MNNRIHILIVEDQLSDFELAQRAISESLKNCVFLRVETQSDFLNALKTFQPDVILSDYALPKFDGMKALRLCLEEAPLTPFIIWTGSTREDIAVECIKSGASDYVIKDHIKRLGPAIVRAIDERNLLLERKQAEDAIHAQEKRFRALIENSLDSISILSEDGTLLWENPAVKRNLGYAQDMFVNRNIFELMHPDDIHWIQKKFDGLLKRVRGYENGVFRLLHQDGSWRWIEAVATNLLDDPNVHGIVVNYHDITERRQSEIELQEKNDDLAVINIINDAVIKGDDLETIMNLFAEETKRLFSCSGCSLYTLNHNETSVIMQYSLLYPDISKKIEHLLGQTIPLVQIPLREGGVFHKVLKEQTGMILNDSKVIMDWMDEFVETDYIHPMVKGSIRKLIPQIYKILNITSVMAIPLVANGKTMGILSVSSPILFTKNELKRIENIGKQLNSAIQYRRANDRIQRSEKFLQNVQDSLSASIAILDKTGVIVRINSAWRKFGDQNGLTSQEYGLGLNYLDICASATGPYAEESEQVAKTIRDAIDGKISNAQIEYPCHSPEERRWFILKITTFKEEDQVWVVLAHENITDRKLAEEAISETSEQFKTLFEASPEAVTLIDPQGDWPILDCNELACTMNGYKREELIGQSINILNLSQGEGTERADYIERIRQEGILRYETFHRHKDGHIFPVEVSTSLITLGGRAVVLGIDRDITERKNAEKLILESEERFRQLAENIQEVFWMTDAISNEDIYISPVSQKIWGYSQNQMTSNPSLFLQTVFEKDRPAVSQAIKEQRSGIKTEMEYRIVRSDGAIRWIWDRAFPIFDDNGRVIRVAGVAADITERKRAEEALRQSEDRYRQLLLTAPVGVGVHVDGKLVFVNEAAAKIIGAKSPKDLIGMSALDFVPIDERKDTVEALQHMLAGDENWYPREERLIRPDGSIINVEVTATALTYMGRQAIQVIVQDITERKRAQKEIERYLAEMQALYENGLAVGQLLSPRDIGERVIKTFSNYLSWHHVTIRLLKQGSDELELVAFSLPDMLKDENDKVEQVFSSQVKKVGEGLSGWVVETGRPIRTGNVRKYPQYVGTYEGINSGLYMPLKAGDKIIGVISVESEEQNAFNAEDERLLATLSNQASIAFENARLYHSAQRMLEERNLVEKALRASETHYRELADSITDVFFELNRELRFSYWNKASEALTGVTSINAIGKTMNEVFGQSAEQMRIEKIYEKVLQDMKPQVFETTFVLHGVKRSFETTAYPSSHGVSVVAKDVTERKRAETILQKRFELMEFSAHHSLSDLMQKTTDEVGDLTNSEIAFFHFIGPDEITLSARTWSTKAMEFFRTSVSEDGHDLLDQTGAWAEAIHRRQPIIQNDLKSLPNQKGETEAPVEILREIVIPIIRDEKVLAIMGIANKPEEYTQQDLETAERFADHAWDIAERKQMEAILAEERNQLAKRVEDRTAELIKANSNLARALRVKDEFLANMSHELRTPLNAILGLSESLAEKIAGPLNDKQLKYITTISESGHHLLSLINDILDLAKIEAGQITLDVTKVNINEICQASLRMVKQLAQKKNQEISLNVESTVGLIWADERRLKQMIVNLLSNAVKFTPENGQLGLDVHGNEELGIVEISVWDNGIGIQNVDLPRLFQPFVQLDSGLARESTGTGLGLALVSQMARLHGGSVKVTSDVGKGSRFTITLPWESATIQNTIEKLQTTGKLWLKAAAYKNKKRILVIEDTTDVVMMIQDYLETAGYDVTIAQDGVEGINQAKIIIPDLILMDVQMPRMDGIETTKKLRADPRFKYVPIIALTALAMPSDRERCIEAGMNEYMSKPVNLRALVKTIQKCIAIGEEKTRPV